MTDIKGSIFDYSQRLRSSVGVVGRAGFLATPNLLLYGLGGVAFGHFTYPDAGDIAADPNGKWVTGYTVGGGAEMKVARHWSLRAEYRHLHFDIERGANYRTVFAPGGVGSANDTSYTYRTAADFHLGKIGLVYRIGDDPASAMAAMPGTAEACCDRWTGFSAGVYGAAGMGSVFDTIRQTSETNQVFLLPPPPVVVYADTGIQSAALSGDTKAGMIDLFAGYNWRAGRLVVGGQAEATVYADSDMKSRGVRFSTKTVTVPTFTTTAETASVQFQQSLRSWAGLVGRAGYLATPNLLLYGLAGVEFGHFAYVDSSNSAGGDDGKWAYGYTAGAGAELKLTDRWSLRGEYRYMRFDVDRSARSASDVVFSSSTQHSASTTTVQTRADFNLGKVGLAYSFCYCE